MSRNPKRQKMKIKKDDLFNLSCLKLFEMGVWTEERCLNAIKWGNRNTTRSQDRYIKRMIKLLLDIDNNQPGLIEEHFKNNIQPTLSELQEVHRGREERNKEKDNKEKNNKENSEA